MQIFASFINILECEDEYLNRNVSYLVKIPFCALVHAYLRGFCFPAVDMFHLLFHTSSPHLYCTFVLL